MSELVTLVFFVILVIISFGSLYAVWINGIQEIRSTSESMTENVINTVNGEVTEPSDEPTGMYYTIKEWMLLDLTVTQIIAIVAVLIPIAVIIHLFVNRGLYKQMWDEIKEKKKQEQLRKENSGYDSYLISLQISQKLEYLITSDEEPRMFTSNEKKFYTNSETFEQIQTMLKEIQNVYTNYMKETNLKMNRYEANFDTVLKTIEKSSNINMLDNHKVLEGVFSTIKYIHKDVVGSIGETIAKDLQRDFHITKTLLDRRNKNS